MKPPHADAAESDSVPHFVHTVGNRQEHIMNNEQKSQEQQQEQQQDQAQNHQQAVQTAQQKAAAELDGLANKKPEELTPDELRLMADTMPGEGPGD